MDLNRRTMLATATAALAAPAFDQARGGGGIVEMGARQMAAAIRRRALSSREVMTAHLAQIDRLNPRFNAIVSRVDSEVLLKQAAALDEDAAAGRFHGPLHGLPHAVKDTAPVKGIRSTQGSPILRDNIPAADSLVVARMRQAGLLFVGKTNVRATPMIRRARRAAAPAAARWPWRCE
jgi:amidase